MSGQDQKYQQRANGHAPGVADQIELTSIIETLASIKAQLDTDHELLSALGPILTKIEEIQMRHEERLNKQARRMMDYDAYFKAAFEKLGIPVPASTAPAAPAQKPEVPTTPMHG